MRSTWGGKVDGNSHSRLYTSTSAQNSHLRGFFFVCVGRERRCSTRAFPFSSLPLRASPTRVRGSRTSPRRGAKTERPAVSWLRVRRGRNDSVEGITEQKRRSRERARAPSVGLEPENVTDETTCCSTSASARSRCSKINETAAAVFKRAARSRTNLCVVKAR